MQCCTEFFVRRPHYFAMFLKMFQYWISETRTSATSQILENNNEPTDSKDTMIKVINFFWSSKKNNPPVSCQDSKTFEVLRKLKDEYGSDLDWPIPFPGDGAYSKKISASCFLIVWPCSSALYCTKSLCHRRHIFDCTIWRRQMLLWFNVSSL